MLSCHLNWWVLSLLLSTLLLPLSFQSFLSLPLLFLLDLTIAPPPRTKRSMICSQKLQEKMRKVRESRCSVQHPQSCKNGWIVWTQPSIQPVLKWIWSKSIQLRIQEIVDFLPPSIVLLNFSLFRLQFASIIDQLDQSDEFGAVFSPAPQKRTDVATRRFSRFCWFRISWKVLLEALHSFKSIHFKTFLQNFVFYNLSNCGLPAMEDMIFRHFWSLNSLIRSSSVLSYFLPECIVQLTWNSGSPIFAFGDPLRFSRHASAPSGATPSCWAASHRKVFFGCTFRWVDAGAQKGSSPTFPHRTLGQGAGRRSEKFPMTPSEKPDQSIFAHAPTSQSCSVISAFNAARNRVWWLPDQNCEFLN